MKEVVDNDRDSRGPTDDILIYSTVRYLDYEGELCVVIGRDCKNITAGE
jgi:2-keto-4-pentenoate hydratase/2-oxohepta-3-ene-1,7-dioic acid hydratase in catechol pathway